MIKKIACISFLVTFFLVTFLAVYWVWRFAPSRDFRRLLGGDNTITITSLTIVGQDQEITLSDSAAMNYLTNSFRGASTEDPPTRSHGYTYTAHVKLSSGESVIIGCDVPDDADGMTIAYPFEFGDPKYYWIPLVNPMPAEVSASVTQMRVPQKNDRSVQIL
jgi:hypothetical protein